MPTFRDRLPFYQDLERLRGSKVITYVTGDRAGLEAQIGKDATNVFVEHLDTIGVVDKITLVLYTNGGDTLAAWNIVNLIQLFCKELEVLIPYKAMSAGTLISLGAQRIIMTKQAVLGPIDPSINHQLNPQIPGAAPQSKMPVSVESVNGYIELARESLGLNKQASLALILQHLSDKIHPLVLGQVFRSRTQIKYLANCLLKKRNLDYFTRRKIIKYLCGGSGSHDYTINRREALSLGLNIIKPDDELYSVIKSIYYDFRDEMQLSIPYNQYQLIGTNRSANYSFIRGLIETVSGESHKFVTEGTLTLNQIQVQAQPAVTQNAFSDERKFEGWRKI